MKAKRNKNKDRTLPAFDGEQVLASCTNCGHCNDVSDGPEHGGPYYACEKEGKEHMSNLKGFPFKTGQECCDLDLCFVIDFSKELAGV